MTLAPLKRSNKCGLTAPISWKVGATPPTWVKATIGTSTSAANMIAPCTKSVRLTARKPPNNVYNTTTAVVKSKPNL
ncbi:Uncharacterised protein [Bacillus tequilensis]|nr:Uncharacterised protein [Bacillus tequilensis]